MADYTVHTNDIPVGQVTCIRGQLGFSRYLTRVLDGEELAKDIERQRAEKRKVIKDKARSEFQLVNVEVVCADPANPTMGERYVHERIYQNKDGLNCYTCSKTGKRLPNFGLRKPDGTLDPVDVVGKSLAAGQTVEVYFNAYDSGNVNNGFGVATVVFLEEPKLYAPEIPGGVWNSSPLAQSAPQQAPAAPVQSAPQQAWGAAPVQQAPVSPQQTWGAAPVQSAPQQAPVTNPWGAQAPTAPVGDGFGAPTPEEAANNPWN